MNRRTRILFLDSDCGDTRAAIDLLVASGMEIDGSHAVDRRAFDEHLAQSEFDVIVCEVSVAGLESAAAVACARAAQPEVPVVVLSDALDERTAVACMKAGAADYVLKQHMERLVFAIPRAIAEARDRQRHRGAEEQLNRTRSALLAHAETSSDVVWICEGDPPVVTYASPAVRRWGLAPEDMERDASAWLQRLHPDDRGAIAEEYERWLASDSVDFEQECRIRVPGQEILWVLLRGTAVRGADGALQSCSWTATDITTQKNTEEWIRENEERFRAVFNSSFQYMALLDVTGRVIAANSTMTRAMDEPADAIVGAAYSELATWDGFGDEQAALQAAVAAAARGHTTQFDIRERRPNGEIGNLEVSISPIQDAAGTVTEILAEARDKTQKYRSERAFAFLNGLRPGDGDFFAESARAMAETLDCDLAFVATLDTDDSQRAMLRALWRDGAAQRLHGFRVPGTAMADPGASELLLVPRDLAVAYPDAEFPAADLAMQSAAIAPLRGTEGEVIGFAGVLRRRPMAGDAKTILPIFAVRIAAELERRAGEEKFQSLFAFAPVAILLADLDGRIRTANQQASVLLLHSPAELRRMSLDDLAPASADATHPLVPDATTKRFGPEPRSGRTGHPPLFVRTGTGAEIPAEITVGLIELDGRTALVAAIHDVSARVAAEEALAHAQKMDAVGKITGGVAHDFNNHLSVIAGNLDLIALKAGNNPRIGKLIESATAAIERSSLLTRQLLAFARLQPLRPRTIDVGEYLQQAERLLRRVLREDIELETRWPGDIWSIDVDAAQLDTAMLNLAANAQEAMPQGGRLRIESENLTLTAGEIIDRRDQFEAGEYVRLRISDTGVGIPPSALPRVFEPLFTTRQDSESAGLGLSMVYGFAHQSGGGVSIESDEGVGTVVHLYLPRSKTTAPQPSPEPEVKPEAEADGRRPASGTAAVVLVVDDDDMVREIIASQIRSLGHRVIEAVNGPEALNILRNDSAIDVVLTDVVMPGGMSGPHMADTARRERPDLKVILSSGYAEAGIRDQIVNADDIFLSKPYTRNDLKAALTALLDV